MSFALMLFNMLSFALELLMPSGKGGSPCEHIQFRRACWCSCSLGQRGFTGGTSSLSFQYANPNETYLDVTSRHLAGANAHPRCRAIHPIMCCDARDNTRLAKGAIRGSTYSVEQQRDAVFNNNDRPTSDEC